MDTLPKHEILFNAKIDKKFNGGKKVDLIDFYNVAEKYQICRRQPILEFSWRHFPQATLSTL